ncbi:MAG: pantoate--beta-alanine ligase, partial [Planctomycetota bacterium]
KAGQRDGNKLIDVMKAIIAQDQGQIDYLSIVDAETLKQLKTISDTALVALAVHIGPTRLIDNILIDLNNPPNIV